ncbi:hypothetical protein [Sulfurimonas sp.]|uniref:hypothetical protein n=1 Tax=Sulfurimonas sp. TaxID=2022749 RepID=UPI00261B41CB|nr:hypothetical protein [Sulfurimonas sp.]MDD3452591.1 hypothetical protein [Sulfurimonas sp.]
MLQWFRNLKERFIECQGLKRFDKNFWALVDMQQYCKAHYDLDIFNEKDQIATLPAEWRNENKKCYRALFMVKAIIDGYNDKELKKLFRVFVPTVGGMC